MPAALLTDPTCRSWFDFLHGGEVDTHPIVSEHVSRLVERLLVIFDNKQVCLDGVASFHRSKMRSVQLIGILPPGCETNFFDVHTGETSEWK